MRNILVSVILPTFNGARYLRESIESCLEQTYTNIEIIIVDDCSTDATASIVKSYDDHRIKYIRHNENKKLPSSLNTGFANASGEYLTWTSDDNYYVQTAIEEMVHFLDDNPDIDFVCTDYFTINEMLDTNVIEKSENFEDLIYSNIVGACFLYRRNIYDTLGGYNTKLFLCEDYEYWVRIYINNYKMKRLRRKLYYYRIHSNSLTSTAKARSMLKVELKLINIIFGTSKYKNRYILRNVAISRSYYRTSIISKGFGEYLSAYLYAMLALLYNPKLIADVKMIKLLVIIPVFAMKSIFSCRFFRKNCG